MSAKGELGNTVHVVLAVYDPGGTYSRHAGVVMASIFERTESPVCVHILHDETLTELNHSLLSETAESFGQTVSFYDVSAYIERLGDATIRAVQKRGWSAGTLFRLAITDILSLDKIIYLDCDIVVNMDIRELWDIPLDDCSCAGVLESPRGRFSATAVRMRLMGCDPEKYINAGVLLMDIPRMKEKLDISRVLQWFTRYRYCMKYQDQDLINSCFRGEIKILEGRFNNHYANRNEGFRDDINSPDVVDSILHASITKPWAAPKGSAVDRLYWRAFLKTPWGGLPAEELFDMIIDIFQKSPFNHRRTSQCYGKIASRLLDEFRGNYFFTMTGLFVKYLYYEAADFFQMAGTGVPKPGDRVLWIRFLAFGDVLQDLVDVCNFKRRFPEVHLTFLSYPEYEELVKIQPYIDDVLTGYKKPFAEWRKTVQKIRAGRYQWLVNTHQGGKSSLFTIFSQTEHRIGTASLVFFKRIYHANLNSWSRMCGADIHDRSLPSIVASAEDRESALACLADLPEPRLFAAIGAGSAWKMWPAEQWIEFLRPLVNDGWGVVLNGHGPTEEAMGLQIESALASGNVLNLIGALDFRKMSGVVHHCTMALGNDTGPLHLAALSGVPAMGLFNYPAIDSALDLLNVPWFRELRAEDYVARSIREFPLKNLPAEAVSKEFGAFATEFLPRAFEWRDYLKT